MSSSRGAEGSRGRRGTKFQPRSNARRSAVERAAQEEAENSKERQRQQEAERAANRARGRGNHGRGRGGGGFRGGLSGWQHENRATGFLGEALILTPESLPGSTVPSQHASRELSQVQKESPVKSASASKRSTRRSAAGSSAKSRMKKEDGEAEAILEVEDKDNDLDGYGDEKMVDANFVEQANRLNIDDLAYNNLISDDEEQVDKDGNPRKALYPIRLKRRPHKKQKTTIDTTASSKHAEQIRHEAMAQGVSVSDIQMTVDGDSLRLVNTADKGKQRDKTMRDSQEYIITDQHVKKEDDPKPVSLAGRSSTRRRGPKTREYVELSDDDSAQKQTPQLGNPRRNQPLFSKPILQTPEDHEEWERHLADMRAIAEELGNNDENIHNTAASKQRESNSHRDNKVYLLQLPSVMPNLRSPSEMALIQELLQEQQEILTEEVQNQTAPSREQDKAPARPQDGTEETPVKVEDDARGSDPHSNRPPESSLNASSDFKLKGYVGTLTIYESGATALDWGGVEFQLERAIGSMLQETLLIDDKSANSMSQVAASFIVKPNWDKLLDADS